MLKKITFILVALAFFLVPWMWGAARDYAPGVAVFAGIIFAVTWGNPFAGFTSKITSNLLGLAIVGMGCGMNLHKVLQAGTNGFIYTFAGIVLGLGLGAFIGKKLSLPVNSVYLVSTGTSICGGSAIAAAAPALGAKAHEVAVASVTVFALNAVALLVFPAVGHWLGFSQEQFGYFAALAIHDTSSVVGACFQYGDVALETGTTVKLARALWIVPVTVFLSLFIAPKNGGNGKLKIKVPWFIPGFIVAAAAVTFFPVLENCGSLLKDISKYLMVMTLFLIGANLDRAKLRELGIRPVLHGVILWVILSVIWGCAVAFNWVKCVQ